MPASATNDPPSMPALVSDERESPDGATPGTRSSGLARLAVALIRFYRLRISPCFPSVCRFTPTCSEYAIQAIEKYGLLKGGWLALKRLLKCHPMHPGGHDPLK